MLGNAKGGRIIESDTTEERAIEWKKDKLEVVNLIVR